MRGRRPIQILIVEDNPGDARLAQEALDEAGVESHVSIARDGVEALEFLRREGPHAAAKRPDLMLVDLNMPRMGGHELLEQIKGSHEFRRIPVLILSTSSAEADVNRSYDLHANCYLTKPGRLDSFFEMADQVRGFWLGLAELPTV